MEPPKTMTPVEAARFLNISHSHIHALLRKGAIPCVRMGRAVRITEADALAYFESCKQVGPAAPHEPGIDLRAASRHLPPLPPLPSRRRS